MSGWDIIISAASALFSLVFLFLGTVSLLFIERFVHARVQHRDGPGLAGQVDYAQVWKDLLKVRGKSGGEALPLPLRIRMATYVWRFLPACFLLILMIIGLPAGLASADLPALLLLPMIAAAIDALLMHAAADSREGFSRRRLLPLKVLGATTLTLSVIAVSLRVGDLDLNSISAFQRYFPYHSILSSPGLLLCGITAFCSIYLFTSESPVQNLDDPSLNHSMQYLTVFVQKMWAFCLLCFWVYVFAGGGEGLVTKILFPIKVALCLFVFTLLQASFPKIRTADAGELTARWLLRLCLIGCFLEAVWVGVRG